MSYGFTIIKFFTLEILSLVFQKKCKLFLELCPTDYPFVKSSLEGPTKKLARPVNPKEPISIDLLHVITENYSFSNSLVHIRFLFILLVGYAGVFFRIDDILSLKSLYGLFFFII